MSAPAPTTESDKPKPRLVTIRSRSPTARIFLRSPKKSDSYSLTCRAHDPECTKYLPWIANPKTPITVESNERQIKTWRADSLIGGVFLCIELLDRPAPEDPAKDTYATIGESGFGPINFEKKEGELGIMLASGPSFRGKGYAVEALDMCLAYGFDNLGLGVINFGTANENEPMKQLLEKKFGLEAVWGEKRKDWNFTASREWWAKRQEEKGDAKVVVDDVVENWFEEE